MWIFDTSSHFLTDLTPCLYIIPHTIANILWFFSANVFSWVIETVLFWENECVGRFYFSYFRIFERGVNNSWSNINRFYICMFILLTRLFFYRTRFICHRILHRSCYIPCNTLPGMQIFFYSNFIRIDWLNFKSKILN